MINSHVQKENIKLILNSQQTTHNKILVVPMLLKRSHIQLKTKNAIKKSKQTYKANDQKAQE